VTEASRTFKAFAAETPFLLLVCVIVFTAAIRLRFLDVPLERDEGEYATMAQLILEGVPPYAEAYNMKFPGIYFAYAVILAIFGQTLQAIHFGLLLVNTASIILVYFIGKTLVNGWMGFSASAAFALLTLSNRVQGFWANAEHFVVLFALAGLLALLRFRNNRGTFPLILSGLMFGTAVCIKQHGAFLALAGCLVAYSVIRSNAGSPVVPFARQMGLFLVGLGTPLAAAFLSIAVSGTLDRFLFWSFTYARAYASILDINDAPHYFRSGFLPLFQTTLLLWLVAGLGFAGVFLTDTLKPHRVLIMSFLAGGFLAVTPGFIFRPHYFILLIPAAALSFGLGIEFIKTFFARAHAPWLRIAPPMIVVVTALASTVAAHADVFFSLSPRAITRLTYGGQPFSLSLPIARFIQERSDREDRIGIIGSEPQIPFYAQRRPASGYLYINSTTEPQPYAAKMREEFMREIESAAPRFLLYCQLTPGWYATGEAEKELLRWFRAYAGEHYRFVARFEWTPGTDDPLEPVTNTAELETPPGQLYFISIYEHREKAGAE